MYLRSQERFHRPRNQLALKRPHYLQKSYPNWGHVFPRATLGSSTWSAPFQQKIASHLTKDHNIIRRGKQARPKFRVHRLEIFVSPQRLQLAHQRKHSLAFLGCSRCFFRSFVLLFHFLPAVSRWDWPRGSPVKPLFNDFPVV